MKKQVTFLIFSLATLCCYSQWEIVEEVTFDQNSYSGMAFVNDSSGFVGLTDLSNWPEIKTLILRTTNYAASWDTSFVIEDYNNSMCVRFSDIYFINENEGWVCGFNMPYILHTEDGGDTWVQQDITSTEPIEIQDADFELIKFYDENYGVVLGQSTGQFTLETFDGGETWNVNDSLFGYDISFIDACNFIINTSGPIILKENCSLEYLTLPSSEEGSVPERHGRSVHVIDQDNWILTAVGLIGFNNFGSIARTTDGGQSYQFLDLFFTPNITELHFRDALNGYVTLSSTYVGNDPCTIMKTDDGGITWHCQETPIIEYLGNYLYTSFSDIECPSPNICYANTGNRIFRTFNGGGPLGEIWTGVDETKSPILENSLQLYPNPTSNQITIAGLPLNSIHDIRVYDASGRGVLSLLNSSENIIQIDHLIAGIYFISITSNDGINQLRFIKE